MENIDIDLQQVDIANVDSVLTGPQGPAGFSPVATVTKVDNVTTITITDEDGTTTAQILDGTNGENGQNNTLTIGTVTTGVNPSATITGDSPNQVLNLVLPKGDTGATGQAGADGTSPTVTVGTTTTLPAGSPATVTQSGTATNVILNFGIPQGDDSNCLSLPTVVASLPEEGVAGVFYFVPKSHTVTTVTGDNLTLTFTDTGAIDELEILGDLQQATPPASPEPLTGTITVSIDSGDMTINLGSEYLAKVTTAQDKIYYTDENWYIHREIGYINSYDGETITTDYVCTSGTLTNGDEVYYVLDTPTDILITDATLINNLNMLYNKQFESGTVSITTSANVTADLKIGYYSYDIHNQYDEYVYMPETQTYERIGV
jgi:hypothetical protein